MKTPTNPKRRRGRPTRAEASAKYLAEITVDPATIDPRAILASIACDATAPASARVQACRVLLLEQKGDSDEPLARGDEMTRRALALMAAGRPN